VAASYDTCSSFLYIVGASAIRGFCAMTDANAPVRGSVGASGIGA